MSLPWGLDLGPSPGQLFLPHPAPCWEPSEIRRAQSRGKQPWESCYQMAEIYKACRYVYTATCLAPGTGVLCQMWVVTEPQLQGQFLSHRDIDPVPAPCTSSPWLLP